jgi:hypothetical protein
MIASMMLLLVVAMVAFLAFQSWAHRRETGQAPVRAGRVSLLTEAVAYVGAILVIAGGATAIGQRWSDISDAGHVGVLAGGAALFLVAGTLVRHVAEPAIQRLVSVLWFVSAGGVAAAVGVAAGQVFDLSAEVVVLDIGLATLGYAGLLWWLRRQVLQQVALFAGCILTGIGVVGTIAGGEPPTLPSALLLWALGISWAVLGWRRYVEPMWAAVPLGVLLALFASTIAVGPHGWFYVIAIGTAAGVMAVSVPTQNPVLLGMGTIAMFGYVTSAVVRYFGDALGIPAALALTGLLILGLALVSARLLKAARPAPPPVVDRARELHPVG